MQLSTPKPEDRMVRELTIVDTRGRTIVEGELDSPRDLKGVRERIFDGFDVVKFRVDDDHVMVQIAKIRK